MPLLPILTQDGSLAVAESEVNRTLNRDLGKINTVFKLTSAFIMVKRYITILYMSSRALAADRLAVRRTPPAPLDRDATMRSQRPANERRSARRASAPKAGPDDLLSTPRLVGRRHPRLDPFRRRRRRAGRRRCRRRRRSAPPVSARRRSPTTRRRSSSRSRRRRRTPRPPTPPSPRSRRRKR